ncbi:unnamed protein product [Acanthoscelides obtectus]|uniref:Centriolar and ciliogenesis-associated protein HYLS1 C-terminal domain-containing protein n=1 Tax=Acanthoscelides obtectus TaxID=200917 RepID=A0A9P0L6N7_ACAOB|nr:unnamed protein product [Acanthoscelides obtectus]CAK1632749.1 hypothetical protein AOBTE_LOCUS7714 [Acanthoscelides obtectus]
MEPMRPDDVLAYLNMLGYTNISAEQLKEFMRDLKRLIKHDLRHNIGNEDFFHSTRNDAGNNFASQRNLENIYNGLFAQSTTVSSEAKHVNIAKEKHICVHITKKHTKLDTDNSGNIEKVRSKIPGRSETPEQIKPEEIPNLHIETELSVKSGPTSKTSDSKSMTSKAISECRKCSSKQKKVNRRDPVALYQYYQSEWNKNRIKIPGQHNHSELRWAIRERLREGPPVEVPLTNKTSCRRVCTYPKTYLL